MDQRAPMSTTLEPSCPQPPPPDTPRTHGEGVGGPPGLPPIGQRAPRHRPNLFRPLLLALIVAVAFAVGTVDTPTRSVGWALASAVLTAALIVTTARRPAQIGLGIAALSFVPWLAIRSSPWLLAVDVVVGSLLVLTALALPPGASLGSAVTVHATRWCRALGTLVHGPGHLAHVARQAHRRHRSGPLRRHARSLVAGVAAFTFALLVLATGDALLVSFLDVGVAGGDVATRVVAALAGVATFAAGLGATHVPGSPDDTPDLRAPTTTVITFLVTGLAAAIACYATVQASAVLLGADFVEGRTGLTYAEYARSGFFQMVAIAAVSCGAIGAARSAARTPCGRTRGLTVAAAVLSLGVVATVVSAIGKLVIYAQTFGLTMLRVYTVAFAAWIAAATVLAFVALIRHRDRWLAPVLLSSLVVGAFALNVVGPERRVAEHNLDRSLTTGKIDVDYLSTLSLDAAPEILDRLDAITAVDDDRSRGGTGTADAASRLRTIWCDRIEAATTDRGLSFHVARRRAIETAAAAC